jgi:hypothetical protein
LVDSGTWGHSHRSCLSCATGCAGNFCLGVIQLYFVQCLLRPLLVGCAFPRIGCSCCPFDVLSAWHSALCSSVEIKLQKRVTCYVFGQMLLLLRLPQGNLVLFYALNRGNCEGFLMQSAGDASDSGRMLVPCEDLLHFESAPS